MVMPTGNCLVIALVLATSTFSLIIGEDVDNNDENIIPDNMPYPLPGRLVRRNFLRFGKRTSDFPKEGMAEELDQIRNN